MLTYLRTSKGLECAWGAEVDHGARVEWRGLGSNACCTRKELFVLIESKRAKFRKKDFKVFYEKINVSFGRSNCAGFIAH